MPKTRFEEYDKQRMSELAERLMGFVERYRLLADKMEFLIELPNQATLDSAIKDIRTHVGRAEMKVAEFLDDQQHGSPIAAEAKESYAKHVNKKTKKPSG